MVCFHGNIWQIYDWMKRSVSTTVTPGGQSETFMSVSASWRWKTTPRQRTCHHSNAAEHTNNNNKPQSQTLLTAFCSWFFFCFSGLLCPANRPRPFRRCMNMSGLRASEVAAAAKQINQKCDWLNSSRVPRVPLFLVSHWWCHTAETPCTCTLLFSRALHLPCCQ